MFSPETLKHRLSDPATLPRPGVSPALSYGRHRGPAHTQSRLAAVAVTIYEQPDGTWTIPLTLRPSTLQHHGGQVCLPGGQVEPGENVLEAALREFEEELGVRPAVRHHCGELSSVYVYASDNWVHPVVVVIEPPREPWKPDPIEVEQVIALPLDVLWDDDSRTELVKRRGVQVDGQQVDELTFRASAIEHQEYAIWGATALILDQLARILQQ